MRRTKIIATYGPSVDNDKTLEKILPHIDVLRLNLSHGNRSSWLESLSRIAKISKRVKKEVALLADLPGPKIRTGKLAGDFSAAKGQRIVFSHKRVPEAGTISLNFDVYKYVKKGALVSIGENGPRMLVKELKKGEIICSVVNPGLIASNKGVSISNLSSSLASPTKEDLDLAKFAAHNGFDYFGLSFVTRQGDIQRLRRNVGSLPIVAKIERKAALPEIEGIANEADAIMVARGDLAFDIEIERLPIIQHRIVEASRRAGKPVIVATQLLASMIGYPTPTRAEVSDIASAVLEGADCLMLSDETAIGKYPAEAVMMLSKVAKTTEPSFKNTERYEPQGISGSIAYAAASVAGGYGIRHIFVPTETGATARRLSSLRPNAEIMALSNSPRVRRSLSLSFGVATTPIRNYRTTDQLLSAAKSIAAKRRIGRYMILLGKPRMKGSTNMLFIS